MEHENQMIYNAEMVVLMDEKYGRNGEYKKVLEFWSEYLKVEQFGRIRSTWKENININFKIQDARL
jgi:hypothetical protein